MSAAGPPVCLETRVSVLLDASSDEVWSVVRSLNLGQLLPGMFLSSCVKNGPAHRVGSLRVATCKAPASDIGDGSCAGDGAWTYKVMELSDTQRLVGWELVSVESASSTFAPYSSCYQLLRVIPVTTAPTPQCFVSWTAAFSSDAHASDVAAFRTHQQRGLASLRETVLIAGNIAKLDTKGVVPASCRHVMMDDAFPLEECVSAFRAAGGTLVSVDPEALVAKFTLSPTDIVYPVCSSGQNRSQVLRELLLSRVRDTNFTGQVLRAHAAIAGVDPYVDDAMSATIATEYIDMQSPGFTEAFGHGRGLRLGEDENPFGGFYEAGDPFLRASKEWFTSNVYRRTSSMPKGSRRVYLTFDKPVHAVLKRLVEAAGPKPSATALSDVVVVAIPMGDIVAHPPKGIERDSAKACKHAFTEFEKLLDFSMLQSV